MIIKGNPCLDLLDQALLESLFCNVVGDYLPMEGIKCVRREMHCSVRLSLNTSYAFAEVLRDGLFIVMISTKKEKYRSGQGYYFSFPHIYLCWMFVSTGISLSWKIQSDSETLLHSASSSGAITPLLCTWDSQLQIPSLLEQPACLWPCWRDAFANLFGLCKRPPPPSITEVSTKRIQFYVFCCI